MSPRMRPSSTVRSMPSRATVVPNDLRRPRASMHGMASALLLRGRLPAAGYAGIKKLFGREAEPLNGRVDPGPFLGEEFPPLALQQQVARAGIDEHAESPPLLDQLLVG